MGQLDLPWTRTKKPSASTARPKGLLFLVSFVGSNFRWFEPSPEAAIRRAELLARSRKASVTLYEGIELEGKIREKVGQRLACFNQRGERFDKPEPPGST